MAFRQSKAGNGFNVSSLAISLNSLPLTGSALIVGCGDNAGSAAISSVTDNAGNTYVQDFTTGGGGYGLEVWKAENITPAIGTHTITIHFVGATVADAVVQEFPGVLTSGSLDKSTGQGNTGTTAIASGTTAAVSQSDELVIVLGLQKASGVTLSLGTGYSNLDYDSSQNPSFGMESKIISTGGAQSGVINSSSSADSIGAIVTYRIVSPAVTIQKSLKYTVKATASAITKSLKYAVLPPTAVITKGLTYGILLPPIITPIQKSYRYESWRGNSKLGDIQNVISEFGYTQNINSAGAQVTIRVQQNADTPGEELIGNRNESNKIRNGNNIKIYEISSLYPNGKLIFNGYIQAFDPNFDDDTIDVTVLSVGADLDNYIIQNGVIYTDRQHQTSSNNTWAVDGGPTNNLVGELITAASSYNLAKIVVSTGVDVANGGTNPTTATLHVLAAPGGTSGPFTDLGSVSVNLTNTTPEDITFSLPATIPLTSGQQYLWYIDPHGSHLLTSTNGSGSGGAVYGQAPGGAYLWFTMLRELKYTMFSLDVNSTTSAYTAQDPTNIFKSILDDYIARGGMVRYDNSTDLTGLSVTYTFTTNTTLEGIKKCLDFAPHDWSWHVDVATGIIYFKQTLATPTWKLVKGQHLNSLKLKATIEKVKNKLFLSGGLIAGVNAYFTYQDVGSIATYGQKLERLSDNHIVDQNAADAIGNSFIAGSKDEQYQVTLEIQDSTMDITLPQVGDTVGFEGFQTFVDSLVLQIVSKTYAPDKLTLQLGTLPPRVSLSIEQLKRDLLAEQTINNPSAPS